MKTKSAVEVELMLVRAMLARLRKESGEEHTSMLYGSQQALVWMLSNGAMSPSKLQDLIDELAEEHGP